MKKLNLLIGVLYLNTMGLIIVSIYLFFSIFNNTNIGEKSSGSMEHIPNLFLVWLIIYVVSAVVNIITLVIDYKENKINLIYRKMKRIKIGLIPFWIINFICYVPISAFILAVGHGFGFIIVPIFIFASYTVLIVTSAFSIAYLLFLRTSDEIDNRKFIIHVIWQLFFVTDIIDTFRIIKKYKYKPILIEKQSNTKE